MTYSEDILNIIEALNAKSGGKLRKENDLAILLELVSEQLDHDLLNRIIFTGKSLWKLSETIRRAGAATDATDNLEKELMRHIEDLRAYIYEAIKDKQHDSNSRFTVTYLETTQGCIRNLIDLSHDLAVLKDLQS